MPSQNQQDVGVISRGDEGENAVTNLANKTLPDSEIKTRNNKILTKGVIDRCQEILKSQYKMRDGFWIAYLAKTKKENLFKYYKMEATTGLLQVISTVPKMK